MLVQWGGGGGGGGGGVFGLGQEASIQRLLRDRGNTADSGRPLCEVLRLVEVL